LIQNGIVDRDFWTIDAALQSNYSRYHRTDQCDALRVRVEYNTYQLRVYANRYKSIHIEKQIRQPSNSKLEKIVYISLHRIKCTSAKSAMPLTVNVDLP
jgi:hypothetical protein